MFLFILYFSFKEVYIYDELVNTLFVKQTNKILFNPVNPTLNLTDQNTLGLL